MHAVFNVRSEPTAEAWLAAIFDRNRFGMAMAAIIKIIATTIKSSISEKPFCLFRMMSPLIVQRSHRGSTFVVQARCHAGRKGLLVQHRSRNGFNISHLRGRRALGFDWGFRCYLAERVKVTKSVISPCRKRSRRQRYGHIGAALTAAHAMHRKIS